MEDTPIFTVVGDGTVVAIRSCIRLVPVLVVVDATVDGWWLYAESAPVVVLGRSDTLVTVDVTCSPCPDWSFCPLFFEEKDFDFRPFRCLTRRRLLRVRCLPFLPPDLPPIFWGLSPTFVVSEFAPLIDIPSFWAAFTAADFLDSVLWSLLVVAIPEATT